jgi:hypothetical protein
MPHVRLSQLYDVKNAITLDLQVESHSTGKREMALKYLDKTQTGDLIVYDRGYVAVWFYKYPRLKNVDLTQKGIEADFTLSHQDFRAFINYSYNEGEKAYDTHTSDDFYSGNHVIKVVG